jgi:hypothetical protein
VNIGRAQTELITATTPLTASGNLFPASTFNGVVGMVRTDGFNGLINLALIATGSGTSTITPQSWFLDSAKTYFNVGYQQTNGVASPTRATGAFSLGAAGTAVLQILDPAPAMQFVVVVTGTVSLTAILFLSPL